jgi:hypothetical protein
MQMSCKRCSNSEYQISDGTTPFNFTLSFSNSTANFRLDIQLEKVETLYDRTLSFILNATRAPVGSIVLDTQNASEPVFYNPADGVPPAASTIPSATGTSTPKKGSAMRLAVDHHDLTPYAVSLACFTCGMVLF